MTPQLESKVLKDAYKDDYPIVLLEDDKSLYPELDMFGTDIGGSVKLAFNHLYELGHRRISIVLPRASYSASYLRLNAWKECYSERGLECSEDWLINFEDVVRVDSDFNVKNANYDAALEFMNRFKKDSPSRPTAIIVMVDSFALPIERAFISNGWDVPGDISLVSTMSESVGRYCEVPVTSVNLDQGGARMRALRYLLQRVSGEIDPETPARNFAKPRLIVRNSTAKF
jgi:DNA-binding LacI/PurR family transcriptional regulator